MKRKTTNLVIVLLRFLIAALIALAVFMTWFTKEQTAFLEKSLRDVKNEHSVQDSSDTGETSELIVSSSCHHFLFVGDSRTEGFVLQTGIQTTGYVLKGLTVASAYTA